MHAEHGCEPGCAVGRQVHAEHGCEVRVAVLWVGGCMQSMCRAVACAEARAWLLPCCTTRCRGACCLDGGAAPEKAGGSQGGGVDSSVRGRGRGRSVC